ncbi:uncharacterized protein LOC116347316 [Contarinia nasturtii]|uniref:uncharacterized protein LOC116347316 n=1 Tax=Contarinia nasturtii TaxID=265458 RepID=UPI0012D4964E|nr:uncharacterized protein LOC116347316 [Contarinia nasturtii]
MNLVIVLSVLVAALTVAAVPDDPTDITSLTSLSKRISLIPSHLTGAPSINLNSKDYVEWMKKCCNRTEYDPVYESQKVSQKISPASNNALDRIIIAIKDILTDIFHRARYTDLEFEMNFNKIAVALRNLM